MPRTFDAQTRRAELAEAVERVIMREGIGAVSLRTVAAEAGVALGSLRYVHPTRADLLVGAARHMLEQSTARLLALRPALDARDYAETLAKAMLPLTEQTRAELEVNIALIAESRAVPELRAVRDDFQAGVRRTAEAIVRLLRSDPPQAGPFTHTEHASAARLHALLDGLALALFHHDDADAGWDVRVAEAWSVVQAELDRIGGA